MINSQNYTIKNYELSLMGQILDDPKKLKRIIPYGSLFTDPDMIHLYETIITRSEKGLKHDRVTLGKLVEAGELHLPFNLIVDCWNNRGLGDSFDLYLDLCIRDKTLEKLSQFKNYSYNSFQELKEKVIDSLKLDFHLNQQILKNGKDVLPKLFESNVEKVLSGIPYFDNNEGGFRTSELIYIAGRPGTGKTSYIISNLSKQLKEVKIGFISLEMTADEVYVKLVANRARVDSLSIENRLMDKQEETRVARAMENLYDNENLIIYDIGKSNIAKIVDVIEIMKAKHDIDIVYIDYIQRIRHTYQNKTDRENIDHNSKELKDLAKRLRIPVVCLAQLNRGTEQHQAQEPRFADIKGSGAIEEDADIIIFLHCESLAVDNDFSKSIIKCIVAKNRKGKVGSYKSVFDKKFSLFESKKF